MDFNIKLQIIFNLDDREERMEELRKFTQRYKDHEELKELVQSKLKSLWKNEAIAATKIKDLFSSSPESGTANGKDQSSTNLPQPHADGQQPVQLPARPPAQRAAEATSSGSHAKVYGGQKPVKRRMVMVDDSDEEMRPVVNKENDSESDFDYGDSSAGHEFSSESEDDEVVLGDPELARINAELKAKLPGTYRRDKALLNQVVNYLRSNYKFEIKQTRRRQLRFHNCIPRKQVFENVRKNCSGVIEHRFFSSSNFGKLFKIVFPGCISKTTGTGYKKVNSYLNLVQV